jgi:uncharacterized membrane protein
MKERVLILGSISFVIIVICILSAMFFRNWYIAKNSLRVEQNLLSNDIKQLDQGTSIERISKDSGRIAVYHGEKHSLIVIDSITNFRTKDTDVFLINEDGSNRNCLTCDIPLLNKGFIGQPT